MKKIMNWVMAAALVCSTSVMTSCSSSDDNPTPDNTRKRTEFVEHTRASLKAVASNLNFKAWNSLNYFATGFNQYIMLNDDFDKTLSRTLGEMIQKSIVPFELPEGGIPEDLPADLKTDYKYVATVDLTDFNYTFTATTTGFDVAENDDNGLEILFPNPGDNNSNIENISVVIKGTGDTFFTSADRFSNDSVLVLVKFPVQYDLAISTKSGGNWTKNVYGTIKNAVQNYADVETIDGSTPTNPKMEGWNIAMDLHAAIPSVDGFDLYLAIGQDPKTHKAGLKLNYAHNGYKVVDATAVMSNTNGMTDLSEVTTSSSIMDILSAIMTGNSIDDLTLTLLDDLTTKLQITDCEKVIKIQKEMARARRSYADQQTIGGYVDQLNALISCSMTDKTLAQDIPMRLVTTKVGVDWWTVPALNFADENGYVPMTELLDKESIEYALNIIDHAVDPTKNSIVVARQLMYALQKLQTSFYKSEAAAE